MRCNEKYDTLRNPDQACVGHFDRFGNRGEWRVVDDFTSSSEDESENEENESFFDSDIDYGHGNKDIDEVVPEYESAVLDATASPNNNDKSDDDTALADFLNKQKKGNI